MFVTIKFVLKDPIYLMENSLKLNKCYKENEKNSQCFVFYTHLSGLTYFCNSLAFDSVERLSIQGSMV